MNAVEFVKKFGVKEAVKVIELHPVSTLINISGSCVSVLDLKQIVEAWELVESYGSIDDAKNYLDNLRLDSKTEIEQALNLVEQCNA